jgi:hypothetical protein
MVANHGRYYIADVEGGSLMEIPDEIIALNLKLYEDKWCSAFFYDGMPDGKLHHKEASVQRCCYLQLGILTEEENSRIVRRAQLRADKSRKGMKR